MFSGTGRPCEAGTRAVVISSARQSRDRILRFAGDILKNKRGLSNAETVDQSWLKSEGMGGDLGRVGHREALSFHRVWRRMGKARPSSLRPIRLAKMPMKEQALRDSQVVLNNRIDCLGKAGCKSNRSLASDLSISPTGLRRLQSPSTIPERY